MKGRLPGITQDVAVFAAIEGYAHLPGDRGSWGPASCYYRFQLSLRSTRLRLDRLLHDRAGSPRLPRRIPNFIISPAGYTGTILLAPTGRLFFAFAMAEPPLVHAQCTNQDSSSMKIGKAARAREKWLTAVPSASAKTAAH